MGDVANRVPPEAAVEPPVEPVDPETVAAIAELISHPLTPPAPATIAELANKMTRRDAAHAGPSERDVR